MAEKSLGENSELPISEENIEHRSRGVCVLQFNIFPTLPGAERNAAILQLAFVPAASPLSAAFVTSALD